ncbi:hypothetical protein [Methanobrevibacter sp.]|uniref:hypothetical protein n=1 Tax=Methanobrevibacter sp. TaxID=66852 RepID=UPI002E76751E|nr:hypothetical protein [Methanobrevibacter sp.]MEE1335891.1 hypothetical protein [Methanobrevibacter sp.]
MLNKKFMILVIFFVSLLAVSAVSAADNATDDAISNVENNDDVINQEDSVELDNDNSQNSQDDENSLSSIDEDSVSFEENEEVLSASPPYYAYSVSIYDTTKYYGSSGSISISITPATSSSYSYRYDFYLKVYDSNNKEKISKRFYGSNTRSETYTLGTTSLAIGSYTMKLINYADSHVMKTAKLTVISVPSNAYSVSVSNTAVNYGSTGTIAMTISSASGYYYKYDFYLKVYDSNNNVKISKRYYSSSASSKVTYTMAANELDRGTYTIKIVNNGDNRVMATANLYVKSLTYNAYSVKVSDININYGSSATITMSISPASSSYYYKYDFYLKVYDSNDVEKISRRYYSTSASSKITETYSIGSQFGFGTYKIKILNTYDQKVMGTANLNINKIDIESSNLNAVYKDITVYKVRVSQNGDYKSGLNVIFTCNSEEYHVATDDEGYATLNIHLKSGTYDITTECSNVVNSNIIKINPLYVANKYSDVYVKSLNGYYGNNYVDYGWKGNFEGYFMIYKGNKLLYKTKLNSNGYINDYFKYTRHDGRYGGSAIKNLGTYKAMITDANGKVRAMAKINIKKSPTKIKCKSLKIKVGSKRSIKAYIVDKHGSGKNIKGIAIFKIKGKKYKVKVKKGRAIVKKVKFPYKVKTYKCGIKFLGDKNHKASSKKFKIRLKKLKSYIGTYAPATKAGSKSRIYAWVAIKDLDGTVSRAKSGTVKFTIAGNTYYAKVKNGEAKIKITAPSKGKTYYGKAVYLGKKNIKSSSDKIYMHVKKPASKYKIITTSASYYWITKKSGKFTVQTKIWDMTAGFRAPGKYIDTTLYKNGRQVYNSKYSVKYNINGRWTGWTKYGTTSTSHHRYFVWDSDYVGNIKVKVKRNV